MSNNLSVLHVELHMKDNLLTQIPESIALMKWIEVIEVSHNKLFVWPKKWDTIRLDHRIGRQL